MEIVITPGRDGFFSEVKNQIASRITHKLWQLSANQKICSSTLVICVAGRTLLKKRIAAALCERRLSFEQSKSHSCVWIFFDD